MNGIPKQLWISLILYFRYSQEHPGALDGYGKSASENLRWSDSSDVIISK